MFKSPKATQNATTNYPKMSTQEKEYCFFFVVVAVLILMLRSNFKQHEKENNTFFIKRKHKTMQCILCWSMQMHFEVHRRAKIGEIA